jgi:hypothetical protein
MLLLASSLPIFQKKNTSLRQIILKILRVWEKVSHISSKWCFLGLIWVGTWLGGTTSKKEGEKAEESWSDAEPNAVLPDLHVRFRASRARPVARRWTSTRGLIGLELASDQNETDASGRAWMLSVHFWTWPDAKPVASGCLTCMFGRNSNACCWFLFWLTSWDHPILHLVCPVGLTNTFLLIWTHAHSAAVCRRRSSPSPNPSSVPSPLRPLRSSQSRPPESSALACPSPWLPTLSSPSALSLATRSPSHVPPSP